MSENNPENMDIQNDDDTDSDLIPVDNDEIDTLLNQNEVQTATNYLESLMDQVSHVDDQQKHNLTSPNNSQINSKKHKRSNDDLDPTKLVKIHKTQAMSRIPTKGTTIQSNKPSKVQSVRVIGPPNKTPNLPLHPEPIEKLQQTPLQQNQNQKSPPPQKTSTFKPKPLPTETLNNRYPTSSERGQFDVIFDSDYSQEEAKPPNQLTVSRVVAKIQADLKCPNNAFQSKKVGQKILISFDNSQVANSILNHQLLRENKLIAYIPQFKTIRQGIIKGIPLDCSQEEILNEIESSSTIKTATRLNRFFKIDDQPQQKPTQSILLTFEGQNLPNFVTLWHTRLEVHPYLSPVKRCNNCRRFGHTKKECQSTTICHHCAQPAHEDNVPCPHSEKPPICINCKQNHNSRSDKCPSLINQKNIHYIAAVEGISYLDAKKILQGRSNTTRVTPSSESPPPPEMNSNNFPYLTNYNNNSEIQPNTLNSKNTQTPISNSKPDTSQPRPSKSNERSLQINNRAQTRPLKRNPLFYPFPTPTISSQPPVTPKIRKPFNLPPSTSKEHQDNLNPYSINNFTNLNQHLNLQSRTPSPPPAISLEQQTKNTVTDLQNVLSQLKDFLTIFTEILAPLMTVLSLNDNLNTLVHSVESVSIPHAITGPNSTLAIAGTPTAPPPPDNQQ